MDDKKLKKTVCVATVSLAVTAGVAAGVAIYNSDGFEPSEDNRDIQINQVHFSQNGDTQNKKNDIEKDKSSLFENNINDNNQSDENNRGYVFDSGRDDVPDNVNNAIVNGNAPAEPSGQENPGEDFGIDNIFDITDRRENADVIINFPDIPNRADNGGNGTINDDNSDDSGSDDDSDNTDDVWYDYSDSAKDPQVTKPMPAIGALLPSEAYKDEISKKDNISVVIREGMSDSDTGLYRGQNVDEYGIFCALETYVYSTDEERIYLWGTDAIGSYIRIEGISFDGGDTWNSNFPVTIPIDADKTKLVIKVGYRLSVEDESWEEQLVSYVPRDNRIFVLSEKIAHENQTISNDKIINSMQYPEIGSRLNLLSYQTGILGFGEIKMLFPGWRENGRLMSWFYPVEIGRHILEPSDCISLSDEYIVKMVYQWVKPDGTIEEKKQLSNNPGTQTGISSYCSLQTLTDIRTVGFLTAKGAPYKQKDELKVPKYVQAVVMESNLHVNRLVISDTVLYIKNDGSKLRVNDEYIVDDNNPNYCSDKGILYNKSGDEIAGIPYNISQIRIADTIKKVNITPDNTLNEIFIESDNIDDIPEIKFENLRDCKIVVNDDVLDAFMVKYGEVLMDGDNVAAVTGDESITYTYENGVVLGSDNKVRYVAPNSGECALMPDEAEYVGTDAFRDAKDVIYVLLPRENNVWFEKGCFDNCNINTILCHTKEQYDSMQRMLEEYQIEDIEVILINVSSEGYSYYTQNRNGIDVNILVRVPEDISSFDGTIENGTIQINVIGSGSFSGCSILEWVVLPESVRSIGYKAFYNCDSLQGILIDTKDTVNIADRAFDGCTSLRFIASNAANAVMENGYAPVVSDSISKDQNMFYVPADSNGYPDNANRMSDVYGVDSYRIEDIGGSKMLYGVDSYNDSWLAIRSGKTVPENVKLPQTTTQIYSYAFCGAGSDTGSFLINWDDINVFTVNECAFRNSKLSGEIYIGTTDGSAFISIYGYAFAECNDITGVTIKDKIYYLGDYVFSSCKKLEYAVFDNLYDMTSAMNAGLFNYCDNLNSITFNNLTVPHLIVYGNTPYQFNYGWTKQEEEEKLRIHVPEALINDYIMDWRYLFAGYTYAYEDSYYLGMWNSIQNELIDFDNFIFPTDEQVDELLESRLLEAENRLRKMLGIECVSEPSELYRFTESGGMVTLRGIPSYTEELDFANQDVGLPEGWYYDYFAKGAFSRAAKLRHVVIPDNLTGIYSKAFESAGTESEKVVLSFNGIMPCGLILDEQYVPFDFGIDDSKLVIEVPAGCKAGYVEEWSYSLAGYSDYWDMMMAVMTKFDDEGKEYTFDDIDKEISNILNPVQDRLDKLIVEKGETKE